MKVDEKLNSQRWFLWFIYLTKIVTFFQKSLKNLGGTSRARGYIKIQISCTFMRMKNHIRNESTWLKENKSIEAQYIYLGPSYRSSKPLNIFWLKSWIFRENSDFETQYANVKKKSSGWNLVNLLFIMLNDNDKYKNYSRWIQ